MNPNTMVNWMIFLPCIGAVLCLLAGRQSARVIALLTTVLTLGLNIAIARAYYSNGETGTVDRGVEFITAIPWIEAIRAYYRAGVDGISLPLTLLTTGLSVLVILASWNIEKATRAYFALYLFLLTGMLGVFLAMDLFLFYVFFEVSLVPMYFLIGYWGGPKKEYAAIKFFLYTLAGSFCLLVVMLGLYFTTSKLPSGNTWIMSGALTAEELATRPSGKSQGKQAYPADKQVLALTDTKVRELFSPRSQARLEQIAKEKERVEKAGRAYEDPLDGRYAQFGILAFWLTFICFAIKVPIAPLHTWLPDAHVEAPTPISMILAGVLLKMGGYAMMRITWPVFPEAAKMFWFAIAVIGVFSVIYGALCALAQTDWKRLVAYSSVSHMGFVILGLAVLTRTAFDGAYFQMIAHGVTSSMMFFLVGVVYDRAHHRQIDRLGGLWTKFPGYGFWSMLGFFAGMGLPGLCGFIGEVMVLLGTFKAAAPGNLGAADPIKVYVLGSITALSVILTAGYILWMFQRVYMGPQKPDYADFRPVTVREYVVMGTLGLAALVLGILPMLVFQITGPTFDEWFKLMRGSSKVMAMITGQPW